MKISFWKYIKSENRYNNYKLVSKSINYNNLIFGVMPDWNPAEIMVLNQVIFHYLFIKNWLLKKIKNKDMNLDIKRLINKTYWKFCGTLYVCVNKSIESFTKKLPYIYQKILK